MGNSVEQAAAVLLLNLFPSDAVKDTCRDKQENEES